ncbi:MAG: PEP-CTERM sorting domain-containing protein [Planctomycetaceae bacterium]|nr:PEP-CTERM sorting domain-containing protein [Planctomycetaceae bacterium]
MPLTSNVVWMGLLVGSLIFSSAQAQVITRIGDGVEAMFASQSDAFQDSDPTGILWGVAGLGPYAAGAGIPSLPAAPTPSLTPAPGNPFAGGGWTSVFNDNAGTASNTAAQSTIDDNISATPTFTSDVSIAIPQWRLFQAPLAIGYAYEQLNFGSNYLFTFNPGLLAATPALPVFINGSVIPGIGAYAQFDGVVNYTWTPVTVNTSGTISASGPQVSLGQLSYSFLQAGGGAFNTTLFSTGALLATPAGDGVLSLTGHLWIAGDPFDLTVSTVPEPSSVALLGLGAALLVGYRYRKRRHPVA